MEHWHYKREESFVWWQPSRKITPSFFSTEVGGSYGIQLAATAEQVGQHCVNNDIAGYNIYVGSGTLPDLTAAPTLFTQTLPATSAITPPLSGTTTFYVVVQTVDTTGLVSANQQATPVVVGVGGIAILPTLTAPSNVGLILRSENYVRLLATYAPGADKAVPATSWRIWEGTSPPDTDVDPFTREVQISSGPYGQPILSATFGPFDPSTLYFAVCLYRARDAMLSAEVDVSIIVPEPPEIVIPLPSGFQDKSTNPEPHRS